MEILAEVCRRIDDCTCLKSNGKVISLRRIDGGHQGPAFKNILTKVPPGSRSVFDWNPCTNFSEGFGCKDVLMCQKDPIIPADTWPFADSVVDFKVESDGTTTIMYEPLADVVGYKRVVSISLKCDESNFPGEMNGVTEEYMLNYSTYSATLTSKELHNHFDVLSHQPPRKSYACVLNLNWKTERREVE
ncbi:hypothetical protein ACROYT_G024736 [Oculina patagonica]